MVTFQNKDMFYSLFNEFVINISTYDLKIFDNEPHDDIRIIINIDYNNDEVPNKIFNNLENFIKSFSNNYKIEKEIGYLDDEHVKFYGNERFYYIGIDINKNDYEKLKEYYICDKCLNIIHLSLHDYHKCNFMGVKRAI